MILNWKLTVLGHQGRVQIIEPHLEAVAVCGGPRAPLKIVNIRVLPRRLAIETREEDGAPYTWPSGSRCVYPGQDIISETEGILQAEAWLDRVAAHYHIYEVKL